METVLEISSALFSSTEIFWANKLRDEIRFAATSKKANEIGKVLSELIEK